jgi:hypothetical protein
VNRAEYCDCVITVLVDVRACDNLFARACKRAQPSREATASLTLYNGGAGK